MALVYLREENSDTSLHHVQTRCIYLKDLPQLVNMNTAPALKFPTIELIKGRDCDESLFPYRE